MCSGFSRHLIISFFFLQGVIIGKHTGKILFLGIRNKYCSICARSSTQDVNDHICYKNWDERKPSTAMEQDVIVEGFKNSESMHGVRYKYFIGDGDSSVYKRIMQSVPYGRSVHKLECANHCVRNYTGYLHKLAADTNYSVESRKLLKPAIPRLTAAARGAIRHCGKVGDSVENLKRDLRNGPYHIFGEHKNCREYFCDKHTEDNVVRRLKGSGIFDHVENLVERLVSKAPRLLQNTTSNAAEYYMSLVAKFNSGKRINFTQRGSFQRRCHAAALRFQKGYSWESSPYKNLTGKSPGSAHKNVVRKRTREHQTASRRKLDYPENEPAKKKRKMWKPAPHDKDYGPGAEQVSDYEDDDLSPQVLEKKCTEFLATLTVTKDERDQIVQETTGQADCQRWHELRRVRLTASKFGVVCRRKDTTSCRNLVKQLLYMPSVSTPATEYGRLNENVAIKRFEEEMGHSVAKCGLFVDLEHGFLGASPDGVVADENALVEVKCVPSAIKDGLQEKAKKNKSFFLQLTDDKLELKKSHTYYYQVQGTLNVANYDFCYFVVMTDQKQPLHVERIFRDAVFWKNEMVPKLSKFYLKCLLPEIVHPCLSKGRPIREPDYIVQAQVSHAERKKKHSQTQKIIAE